jgi:hypothetical protein
MKTGALVLAALVNIAGSSGSAGQAPAPPPAVPVGAIAGILDAFQTHAIVALSDAHGNEQAHAFLLSLIRDPRFATAVNDIVVEFGSARYQEVIDRFVRGEDIPYESLRRVWQDTTQPSAAADLPINEEFFRAVRAVNGALPRERQLRVLLGDPPIDWDKITNREEHFKWIEMRDSYPAALIQLEVITNGRRALVVYGHGHFQRRNVMSNFEMGSWEAQTIVSLLERSGPTRVFTIWRVGDVAEIQPDAPSWRVPSLATIRGTILGAADAAHYFAGGPTRRGALSRAARRHDLRAMVARALRRCGLHGDAAQTHRPLRNPTDGGGSTQGVLREPQGEVEFTYELYSGDIRGGPHPYRLQRIPYPARHVAAAQRADRLRCSTESRDAAADRLLQDSRSPEQISATVAGRKGTRRHLLLGG